MPKNKNETLCVEDLRHAEYYEMQNTFDDLYAKSKNGDIFTHLMDIILSRENILLAYRNIKANAGSKTAGTDGTIIKDIGKLPAETVVKKVRYIVAGAPHGYRPKPGVKSVINGVKLFNLLLSERTIIYICLCYL